MYIKLCILIVFIFLIVYSIHKYIDPYKPYKIHEIYNTTYDILLNKENIGPSSRGTCNIKFIPRIIHQTYFDKSKIPQKVYDNISKYTKGYTYKIYDDTQIIDFLKDNFDSRVLQRFYLLQQGAHRADLFRYCILYIYGGVYLDIKTELLTPVDNIFQYTGNKHFIYTVLSTQNSNTIYQGIIATTPKNPIFLELIKYIVEVDPIHIYQDYIIFVKDFYRVIKKDKIQFNNLTSEILFNPPEADIILPGYNKGQISDYYLYMEKCSTKGSNCVDGLDRYGLCCYIYKGNNKIIKARYSDFPWK
jgi:hypothetical protein